MPYFSLTHPLPPVLLDSMLAQGWYRMGQNVFTTNTIDLEDGEKTVCWARILLQHFSPNSRHRKLIKLCRGFTLTLGEGVITAEVEALFSMYRNRIDFETGTSVANILLDDRTANFYPTRMWQVRDNGKLIGVGYFDEGLESAAGILNFYHPDYRKYSLGLWLYLESVLYAAKTGKTFFYPGYIVIDYPKFDYKLLAGTERMEIWDPNHGMWIAYAHSLHAQLA